MKAISIYALTREQDMNCLQKMERQLSDRSYFLKMREWELSSMKALVEQLERHMENVHLLQIFYSFQIPRLGKEFDLLQIKEKQIVNIELKSGRYRMKQFGNSCSRIDIIYPCLGETFVPIRM